MDYSEQYMYRCLQLAGLGAGNVAPNPMVGAVMVHNDRIIGEGYHSKYGGPHAEVACIHSVSAEDKPLIASSTLYVSLEPCSHHGKTPPCTNLILEHKIPAVIVGCNDPFEKVNGSGIKILREAGVNVIENVLQHECIKLNARFFTFHKYKRPYIILKWAQSMDHKISGPGATKVAISGDVTNRLVHKWRSEEAAILVGTNTAAIDDPHLTTRLWKGNSPIRLILDLNLRLPKGLHVFDGQVKTIILNSSKDEEEGDLRFMQLDKEQLLLSLVDRLHKENIQSVLVEGGAKLLQSFLNAHLWDEARVITNTKLILQNGIESPSLVNAVADKQEQYFEDIINYYVPCVSS